MSGNLFFKSGIEYTSEALIKYMASRAYAEVEAVLLQRPDLLTTKAFIPELNRLKGLKQPEYMSPIQYAWVLENENHDEGGERPLLNLIKKYIDPNDKAQSDEVSKQLSEVGGGLRGGSFGAELIVGILFICCYFLKQYLTERQSNDETQSEPTPRSNP